MDHHNYQADFQGAFRRSIKWEQIPKDAKLPEQWDGPTAFDTLITIKGLVDSFPHQAEQIRTNCAGVHFDILRSILNTAPCFLTIGDVFVGGKPEYGTSVQQLKREVNGSNKGTDKIFNAHVWLTFPEMGIIDATFYIYKFHHLLSEPWKWSDHIICSGEQASAQLPLRYKPMLISNKVIMDIVSDPENLRL